MSPVVVERESFGLAERAPPGAARVGARAGRPPRRGGRVTDPPASRPAPFVPAPYVQAPAQRTRYPPRAT